MSKFLFFLVLLSLNACSGLFYYPTSYLYSDPVKLGHKIENIRFESTDGTKLFGWYFTNKKNAQRPKGLIVYFHGNAQNISSHYMNLEWITKEGYDFFIPDYRGYGLSEGSPNQQGVHKDTLAALEWAQKRAQEKNIKRFVAYGQSLGGAILLRALKDYKQRDKIDLVILDSTFLSYQKIAFDKLKNAGGFVILSPLAYLLISDEYAPRWYVDKLDRPTLVIHGTLDPIVPYKFGEEIYNKLTTKKWHWKVPLGKHTDVFFIHDQRYRKKFVEFLENF